MEWECMEGYDCPSVDNVAQAETTDVDTCGGMSCDQGFRGKAHVLEGLAPGGELVLDGCDENQCAPVEFGVGVIGGGGDSACFRDDVLTTHTKDSCSVECDVGYAPTPPRSSAPSTPPTAPRPTTTRPASRTPARPTSSASASSPAPSIGF